MTKWVAQCWHRQEAFQAFLTSREAFKGGINRKRVSASSPQMTFSHLSAHTTRAQPPREVSTMNTDNPKEHFAWIKNWLFFLISLNIVVRLLHLDAAVLGTDTLLQVNNLFLCQIFPRKSTNKHFSLPFSWDDAGMCSWSVVLCVLIWNSYTQAALPCMFRPGMDIHVGWSTPKPLLFHLKT